MSEALATIEPTTTADSFALMLERLATNPAADVDKLRALVELHERAEQRDAARAFNEAMTDAQSKMGKVVTDKDNSQTKSRYATYAALDAAVRPVYTEHGFGLSFTTERTDREAEVRVVCLVSHRGGYVRRYEIEMPADGKGAKGGDVMTRTHATGSAVSYGMRYLLKMIFNIATGERTDDDGNGAGRVDTVTVPAGFGDWWADLAATADEGTDKLQATWGASPKPMKEFAAKYRLAEWNALKAKAAAVPRG
mgnify:FL=1